jgi:hypothetical protein
MNFRELLQFNGIGPREFATRSGYGRKTVQRWWKNNKVPEDLEGPIDSALTGKMFRVFFYPIDGLKDVIGKRSPKNGEYIGPNRRLKEKVNVAMAGPFYVNGKPATKQEWIEHKEEEDKKFRESIMGQ